MPLDLGKGIFNLNYEREQLSDGRATRSPKGQWQSQSHRIYHGTVFAR
ncbi:hypothetical protein [Nostoc sp. UHCC 0251]|nr:hypothetical protein [Nostoc sp. UHCC 0251]MEA5623021.1 hypothetical protein [Nostoc sp. UHCC 0251]